MNQIISDNYHLIDMNKYISDTIKICLHKYNHYYDNIQTDIDINENIIKNNDLIILLNNKSFHFINEIIITFKNDFDNKLYFLGKLIILKLLFSSIIGSHPLMNFKFSIFFIGILSLNFISQSGSIKYSI